MKINKILTGLVLVVLFSIPQIATAEETAAPMQFIGNYIVDNSEMHGDISGEIKNGILEGSMIIRGIEYNINLVFVKEVGQWSWYSGSITRMGREYDMRMMYITHPEFIIGPFCIPEMGIEGHFWGHTYEIQ